MIRFSEHGKGGDGFCRRAATLSLAAVLTACAADTPPPTTSAQVAQPAPRRLTPHRSIVRPKGKPGTATPNEASLEAPAPEPEAPQTAAVVPSSSELIGLDPQRTTELLGPAAATDSRAPATVWHYKSARCALDLAFYMEMRSGQMRTLHYEFKGDADNDEQRQACLKAIIEENRKLERS